MNLMLTDGEKAHPLWRKIEQALREELEVLRSKNDNPELGAEATAALRGHIRCLKGIISLGSEMPAFDVDTRRIIDGKMRQPTVMPAGFRS